MNQFKFGDKVVHEEYGTGVVVDERTCIDGMSVLFPGDTRPCLLSKEEVIPASHPDTVRLNALKEKISKISNVSFSCNLCGEGNEISAEIQDIIDFAISEGKKD